MKEAKSRYSDAPVADSSPSGLSRSSFARTSGSWFNAPFAGTMHFRRHHEKVLSTVTKYPDVTYGSVGSTSSSLLDRVKVRDEAAWRRLVSVYGQLVLYWCRCAGIRREDRVDVCQEVFRAVAANIDGFRHDQPGDTFRGWLRTITRNKVADHFRRQNRQPAAPGGSVARERLLAIPDGDASSAAETGNQEKAILVNRRLI